MSTILGAGAALLALVLVFGVNELFRPYLLRWERTCAVIELRCYQDNLAKALNPHMKTYWQEVIIECRARHRRRLGELPE